MLGWLHGLCQWPPNSPQWGKRARWLEILYRRNLQR